MQITKSTATDGFVVVDLPDAASSHGIVRCAKKILQDGAVNLARSLTYAYAAFAIPTSGASAGINAEGEARNAAVAAFVEEVAPLVAAGSLRLDPGKGVTAADLAPWGENLGAGPDLVALAAGILGAAAAVTELNGATVGVEAGAPGADEIVAAFASAGADAAVLGLADLLAPGRSVVVVGSKSGILDHNNIESLGAAVVVGAAGLAVTARALAMGSRNGATILPDFVTSAGPLLAAAGETDVGGRVGTVVAATLGHEEGPYLGACYAAEEFLRTWTAELPFGRPLA